ncbi:ABC transporter ATP-binding protein [Ensifer adhaerens]|uniref:ABC transporter ATP-binding protein n=1 Tax=Ensifer adhaerens TaxID=106592 RepID=UPI001CBDCA94|nr:ABC transporter ATP-binding protein [Ensifer adhaerens]MBZ7924253.1 ABC transporter ATP-binding protein [Ensifer adhaerens]UAX96493.1 ABC transporter ATP-binding protein [Ensifer adhaerens]UAY04163.1 ABC transporter ATP-binding protein [Ensifer adhaerens]UAY12149.1 ABC transporter ATP-binding protein [Ensifer adhaerens]
MLSIRDLSASYGAKDVLHGISLDVPRGTIVTILGANGAGKSTLMKAIVGLVCRTTGSVEIDGKPLPNETPDRALRAGVSLVPEQRELFLDLSVADNLRLGAFLRRGAKDHASEQERLLEMFPNLRARLNQPARALSGGEQQMLAIARALMGRPSYLLLDEPSLGLAPKVVTEIFEVMERICTEGTSVLLVEQNASIALDIAHSGYVLELGEITLSGPSEALRSSSVVQTSYL